MNGIQGVREEGTDRCMWAWLARRRIFSLKTALILNYQRTGCQVDGLPLELEGRKSRKQTSDVEHRKAEALCNGNETSIKVAHCSARPGTGPVPGRCQKKRNTAQKYIAFRPNASIVNPCGCPANGIGHVPRQRVFCPECCPLVCPESQANLAVPKADCSPSDCGLIGKSFEAKANGTCSRINNLSKLPILFRFVKYIIDIDNKYN